MYFVRFILISLLLSLPSMAHTAEIRVLFDTSASGTYDQYAHFDFDEQKSYLKGVKRYDAMKSALVGFYLQINIDLQVTPWSEEPHVGFRLGAGHEAVSVNTALNERLPKAGGSTEFAVVLNQATSQPPCRIFVVLTDGEDIDLVQSSAPLSKLVQNAPVGVFVVPHDKANEAVQNLATLSKSSNFEVAELTVSALVKFVHKRTEQMKTCGMI